MENKKQIKKEYDKLYYIKNRSKKLIAVNEYNKNNKNKRLSKKRDTYKSNSKKYINKVLEIRKKQPLKYISQWKANYYIPIPKDTICAICKLNKAVDRHHEDYNKPLDVIFLCRSCHRKEHIKLRRVKE